jgi:hypothetical protein
MIFYTNSMVLNVTAASNHACSLGTQGFYFYQLVPHSGGAYPNYYVGYMVIEGVSMSVCLYFNNGVLKVKVDNQGSCPSDIDPATCSNGWNTGFVDQVWSGSFRPSTVPTGSYFGNINIVPYSQTSTGARCSTCYPVRSAVSVLWNGDTFVLTIQGASTGSCTLYTQTYAFTEVVEYGFDYPNYYYGLINVNGYNMPVCFYWDTLGSIIFRLDGQGTCPHISDQSYCTQSGQYVLQSWVGQVSISSTETM